jgi:hypothetical protein
MAGEIFTRSEIETVFHRLDAEQERRERDAEADQFWQLHLGQGRWPPALLREVVEHDRGRPAPQPVDVSALSMEEWAAYRAQAGITSAGAVLGTQPWQRSAPTTSGTNQGEQQ